MFLFNYKIYKLYRCSIEKVQIETNNWGNTWTQNVKFLLMKTKQKLQKTVDCGNLKISIIPNCAPVLVRRWANSWTTELDSQSSKIVSDSKTIPQRGIRAVIACWQSLCNRLETMWCTSILSIALPNVMTRTNHKGGATMRTRIRAKNTLSIPLTIVLRTNGKWLKRIWQLS